MRFPPMPATVPESATGLYWNTRGNIRCELHVRELEPQRLESERWEAVPEAEEPKARKYQCQRCAPDGNAIGR